MFGLYQQDRCVSLQGVNDVAAAVMDAVMSAWAIVNNLLCNFEVWRCH